MLHYPGIRFIANWVDFENDVVIQALQDVLAHQTQTVLIPLAHRVPTA
jgi:hypothetical protein